MHPFFDTSGTENLKIIAAMAHRGFAYSDGHPNGMENSMTAFAAAVDLGYTYLETDCHGTLDDVAVVCHDDTLDRTTDSVGVISEMNWSQVRKAHVGGVEPIPSLQELLDTWPHVRVNVDIKDESAVEAVAKAIDRTKAHDRVCVTSFSTHRRRACLARLSAPTAASAGISEIARFLLGVRTNQPWLARAALRAVDAVQVPVRQGLGPAELGVVDAKSIKAAHFLGKFIHVWTVDEPPEMHRLIDLGVDGLITDRADLLREVLIQRGEWL